MNTIELRLQAVEGALARSRRVNQVFGVVVVALVCLAVAQNDPPGGEKPAVAQQSPAADGKPGDAPAEGAVARPRIVAAEQFVLLDADGRLRAKMLVTEAGPVIGLFDADGRKRLELSDAGGVASLRMFDDEQSPVVSLELPQRDPAQLDLRGSTGSTVVKSSGVFIRDADERQHLLLALINGNFPTLGVGHVENGPPTLEMTAGGGSSAITFHNRDGFPLLTMGAGKDGASLGMSRPDDEQSLRISNTRSPDSPAIQFFGRARGGTLPFLSLGFDDEHKPHMSIVGSDGVPIFTAPSGKQ